MYSLILFIITIDQITKRIATYYFERHIFYSWWKFSNVYTCNQGISFSLLSNTKFGFLLKYIMCILIILTLYLATKTQYKKDKYALSFITAGGISNLLDRFLFNGVIDFIHFDVFMLTSVIFNIADIAITLGALLLCFNMLFNTNQEN